MYTKQVCQTKVQNTDLAFVFRSAIAYSTCPPHTCRVYENRRMKTWGGESGLEGSNLEAVSIPERAARLNSTSPLRRPLPACPWKPYSG